MCHSKRALQRGIHPSPKPRTQAHHHHHHNQQQQQQQQVHHLCSPSRHCIYCNIWKLANLVSTHVSLSTRYNTTASQLQHQYYHQSFSLPHTHTHDSTVNYETLEQQIEAAFSIERSRLSSIMSICIVDGAAESGGLHIAYRRCLDAVERLLVQEAMLEEALIIAPLSTSMAVERTRCELVRPSVLSVL